MLGHSSGTVGATWMGTAGVTSGYIGTYELIVVSNGEIGIRITWRRKPFCSKQLRL